MIRNLFNLYYLPCYSRTLVYMLQSTEYRAEPYLRWYWRIQNFGSVMYRRQLDLTQAARLLRLCLIAGMTLQIVVGFVLIVWGQWYGLTGGLFFGLALLVCYPVIWAHLVVVPLVLGRVLIVGPRERGLVKRSEQLFAKHPGVKIAVAGSYGKTSMKELLVSVLSEGKTVAATPANKNVTVSHAYFAQKLNGSEDILIIEYGEGKPGDVAQFARITHPTHGIITGLAAAHLDRYGTVEAAGKDIFSLAAYLNDKQVYVNSESAPLKAFIKKPYELYDHQGALGWRAKDIKLTPTSTSFKLSKGKLELELTSGLLGVHQVGPLSLAAALGIELGLSKQQVVDGVAKTLPFEHRMQPYSLGGAWIIDDTYNGNLEGVRAGTALLAALKAKRKHYITPGLVDQGKDSAQIHIEMGALIAAAKPDSVVLMQNSATKYICEGLERAGYKGSLKIEHDPLNFYTNLEHFVAAGDVVLMQNDWTDNYA